MQTAARACLFLFLLMAVLVYPCGAERMISIDLGYVDTETKTYGEGLVYGASIIEGKGRIGFGVALRRFSNSILYDVSIKEASGTLIFQYEEAFSDFYLNILATYNLRFSQNTTHIVAGIGPQVHFVQATKYFITEGYSVSARDYRLGVGAILRLEHRIHAFGRMAFVVNAGYSWADSGDELSIYDYQTPQGSMTFPTITAGLAFPF
jgi:hypothetical protein